MDRHVRGCCLWQALDGPDAEDAFEYPHTTFRKLNNMAGRGFKLGRFCANGVLAHKSSRFLGVAETVTPEGCYPHLTGVVVVELGTQINALYRSTFLSIWGIVLFARST